MHCYTTYRKKLLQKRILFNQFLPLDQLYQELQRKQLTKGGYNSLKKLHFVDKGKITCLSCLFFSSKHSVHQKCFTGITEPCYFELPMNSNNKNEIKN